jgi:hypothetical protein
MRASTGAVVPDWCGLTIQSIFVVVDLDVDVVLDGDGDVDGDDRP